MLKIQYLIDIAPPGLSYLLCSRSEFLLMMGTKGYAIPLISYVVIKNTRVTSYPFDVKIQQQKYRAIVSDNVNKVVIVGRRSSPIVVPSPSPFHQHQHPKLTLFLSQFRPKMPIPLILKGATEGLSSIPYIYTILKIVPWVLLVGVLKFYFGGARNQSERLMHSKVVMVTVWAIFPI